VVKWTFARQRAASRASREDRPVSLETLLAGLAVLTAGAVHSTTGFGFALVATPVLVATHGPLVAIPTVTLLSLVVNVLTLTSEQRPTAVLRPATELLIVGSVPGMAVGAVVLAQAPEDLLRMLVAASVLLAVAVHLWTRRRSASHAADAGPAGALGAGAVSGLLTTSTSLNGPPLVLYLLGARASADQARDSLAAIFVATGLLGLTTFAIAGTLELASALPGLVAAAAVGQVLGRLAFARVAEHHEGVSLAVLAISAAVALAAAIHALL
jgi:uncharacterized membrane protein YfcA